MRDLRLRLVTAYDNMWLSLHEATLGWLVDTIGLLTTVRGCPWFLVGCVDGMTCVR